MLEFSNLSSSRHSRKSKPREYYQIYSITFLTAGWPIKTSLLNLVLVSAGVNRRVSDNSPFGTGSPSLVTETGLFGLISTPHVPPQAMNSFKREREIQTVADCHRVYLETIVLAHP